ncbi:STY0301 family protein [Paraburkholderia sp. J63]|uniref:STY0301 family protein n=1 Tax=Paraburkholderia sp. J63 TaxID=2805434 RepID=UPI0039F612B6
MNTLLIRLGPGFVLAASIVAPGSARAVEITCPARITTQPAVVTDAPNGWQVVQRSTSHAVQGVLVTVGQPQDRVDLKPRMETVKGSPSFTWEFDPAQSSKGLWLSCGYGGSPVLLSQKLPGGISQCRADGPTVDSKGTLVMNVRCK